MRLHPRRMLVGYDWQPKETCVFISQPEILVAEDNEHVALVQQLLHSVVNGVVDAKDVGVKVVCSRAAAIVVEIVFELLTAPYSLDTSVLAIEQVAVDPGGRRDVSELFLVLLIQTVTLTDRAAPSEVES